MSNSRVPKPLRIMAIAGTITVAVIAFLARDYLTAIWAGIAGTFMFLYHTADQDRQLLERQFRDYIRSHGKER